MSPRDIEITSHPILVIARGRFIEMIQMVPCESLISSVCPVLNRLLWLARSAEEEEKKNPASAGIALKQVGSITLEANVIAVEWLGGQVIVALTEKGDVRVIDPVDMVCLLATSRRGVAEPTARLQTELETLSIKSLSLTYHELFPNLAEGASLLGLSANAQVLGTRSCFEAARAQLPQFGALERQVAVPARAGSRRRGQAARVERAHQRAYGEEAVDRGLDARHRFLRGLLFSRA